MATAFALIILLAIVLFFVVDTLRSLPKPEQQYTMTQETWDAIQAKSPEWAEAMKPFIGVPIPKSLANSLMLRMLSDIHGVER